MQSDSILSHIYTAANSIDLAIYFAQFIIGRVNPLVHVASLPGQSSSVRTDAVPRTHEEASPLPCGGADKFIGILIGISALVLYWRTLAPTVLDGDSGEYQYLTYVLGVPHSPGYPLYIFLGKLFTLIPVGQVAYRVNLLSAVSAALAASLVYWAARRMIVSRASAALATLICVVAPSMWGSAVVAEVYALHLLLGVLVVLLALHWHQTGNLRSFYGAALVYGLGLTNHPISWFMLPALLSLLWMDRARLNWGSLARGTLLVLLPLLMYVYIPIRAGQLISLQDPENWKLYPRADAILKGVITEYYNHTPEGVLSLITGFDNRGKVGQINPLDRLQLSTTLLWAQFGLAGTVLSIIGGLESLRKKRSEFLFLAVVAASVGGAAFVLKGVSTVFYFTLTYFVLTLWIAIGIDALARWARSLRLPVSAKMLSRALLLALGLVPLAGLVGNYRTLDKSNNFESRDDAQTVLRQDIAPDAVVAAPWEVSQPMRYYQFVENQRPDLLIVHVACDWQQWSTMLANARSLNRPFYSVEFTPALKTDSGPRSVQPVPLPMLQAPRPRYAISGSNITPEVQVLGYDLDPDPPQPGKPARLWVYYRATARMYPMYTAMLTVGDITGRLWNEARRFPVSSCFPTYRWYELGEYYRDGWTIDLPTDAPNGLYNIDLSWFVYNLDARTTDYDSERSIALGTVRVGDFSVSGSRDPLAQVGDAISLMGWESIPSFSSGNAVSVVRGQTFGIDLMWRGDRAISQSYTVFVHLIDSNGRVVADADSPPLRGLFPTVRWVPGETIRDRHTLKVPADIAPGNYAIEVGMYEPADGVRLTIGGADTLVLTQVKISDR